MYPNLIKLVLFAFLNLFANVLSAQKVMKNTNGEIIVQYQDGSWRYYDPKDVNDVQLLEEQNRRVKEKNAAKMKENRVVERTKPSKQKKTKTKNKKPKIAKSQKSKKSKNNKIASSKKSKKPTSPKFSKKKSKKSKQTRIVQRDKSKFKTTYPAGTNFNEIATKAIVDANSKKLKIKEEERKALFQKNILEDKLKRAKKNKVGKTEIESLTSKLKATNTQLKGLKKSRSVLDKQRRSYAGMIDKDPVEQAGIYAKLEKKFGRSSSVPTQQKTKPRLSLNRKKDKSIEYAKAVDDGARNSGQSASKNINDIPWPKKVDFSKSPPTAKCAIAFQGVDDFTGKKRKDLYPREFFRYTNERMAKFFPDGDMVECQAHLSIVSGGLTFLSVEIVINSESAKTSYGSLEKGTLLTLKLVNGENINLTNNKTDVGLLDPIAKTVTYNTQYLVPSQHIKTLQKYELDLLRLIWGTGYEDYTIYETDFFIDQLNCLLE